MRLSAVERSGWKLVLDRTRERVFLYDVRRDPLEREDRSAAEPAQVAELRAELDAWEARVSGGAAPESAGDVPEEERARLRALGYL